MNTHTHTQLNLGQKSDQTFSLPSAVGMDSWHPASSQSLSWGRRQDAPGGGWIGQTDSMGSLLVFHSTVWNPWGQGRRGWAVWPSVCGHWLSLEWSLGTSSQPQRLHSSSPLLPSSFEQLQKSLGPTPWLDLGPRELLNRPCPILVPGSPAATEPTSSEGRLQGPQSLVWSCWNHC